MSFLLNTLKIFVDLKKDKIIEDFTISGHVAAAVYGEALSTEELKLIVAPSDKRTISLVYKRMVELGGVQGINEVYINRFKVRLVPAKDLELEALKTAVKKKLPEGLTMNVVRQEYLMSLLISSQEVNDLARVINLCCYAKIDFKKIQDIMNRYNRARIYKDLDDKWDLKNITYDNNTPVEAKKAAIHGIKKRYHKINANQPLKEKIKQIDDMLDWIELSKKIRKLNKEKIHKL